MASWPKFMEIAMDKYHDIESFIYIDDIRYNCTFDFEYWPEYEDLIINSIRITPEDKNIELPNWLRSDQIISDLTDYSYRYMRNLHDES